MSEMVSVLWYHTFGSVLTLFGEILYLHLALIAYVPV